MKISLNVSGTGRDLFVDVLDFHLSQAAEIILYLLRVLQWRPYVTCVGWFLDEKFRRAYYLHYIAAACMYC